jgi:hypothetical protein
MVWKTNLYRIWKTDFFSMFEGEIEEHENCISLEGFMCQVFGEFDDFTPRASFKDQRDIFRVSHYLDEKHFPQHILFANFQCLRCGLCCKNYDLVEVARELILDWMFEGRWDALKRVDVERNEIWSASWLGCPFCRKVRNKPYYGCKINSSKKYLKECKTYLCSKSIPVAHLNFRDIDELIELIGMRSYYALIEKDWNEDFDFSKAERKTHRRIERL